MIIYKGDLDITCWREIIKIRRLYANNPSLYNLIYFKGMEGTHKDDGLGGVMNMYKVEGFGITDEPLEINSLNILSSIKKIGKVDKLNMLKILKSMYIKNDNKKTY